MRRSGGKSSKFVPISTADITQEKVLLPGRHACTCEATKHALIRNCLRCGRIVCEQEGSGPCFTCRNLVCTKKEEEIIMRQSKQSVKLYHKLMNEDSEKSLSEVNDPNLQNALRHRDKLLEFDQTVEKRTKVIDDENDYFQTDAKWLNSKEKSIINKKKEERHDLLHNRQKLTFTFDFAGRKIIDEKPQINFEPEELLKPDTSIFECGGAGFSDIPHNYQPEFLSSFRDERACTPISSEESKRLQVRIQDKALQEMSDEGMCLSLHQPYASLLTAGIKKHEGRVWYTSYRGRLWIHAAGKTPLKQEIYEMERFYSSILGRCEFPKTYPPGCLLGCVDLVDCLPQDEYKSQFSKGENNSQAESDSPYVFICENPQELKIKFPMKGKHKIFKLESNLHQAAKKTLLRQTI